jgi:hypothetical protein
VAAMVPIKVSQRQSRDRNDLMLERRHLRECFQEGLDHAAGML